ncbi:cyclic nucleotide-binding domain-containing protein [Agrobacterium sp. ES01]|uniref:cyclic nucleotide-binding domain-containing protein n=1 Tax=Agrobacterium sp. ES01 TaxID=3420714 RepID=UPI003D1127C9
MALNDDIEFLSGVALFGALDKEQLRLIAFGAEHQNVSQGDTLFQQGDAADSAYVITKGNIELSIETRNGTRQVEVVAGPGAILSELALMTTTERKYLAVALNDAEVICISRSLFHRLVKEYPDMAEAVQSRIRDTIAQLADKMAGLQNRFT